MKLKRLWIFCGLLFAAATMSCNFTDLVAKKKADETVLNNAAISSFHIDKNPGSFNLSSAGIDGFRQPVGIMASYDDSSSTGGTTNDTRTFFLTFTSSTPFDPAKLGKDPSTGYCFLPPPPEERECTRLSQTDVSFAMSRNFQLANGEKLKYTITDFTIRVYEDDCTPTRTYTLVTPDADNANGVCPYNSPANCNLFYVTSVSTVKDGHDHIVFNNALFAHYDSENVLTSPEYVMVSGDMDATILVANSCTPAPNAYK